MTQNPLCYGIYGNGWKIANYLIGENYLGSARDVRTSNWMLSSVKRLLVTMVVFLNFFSRVIFLMSPQIVCLKWCKVAKIAFPRFFFRVISNVYTNALLETMLNQNGFICAKFLQIRFANVTPFDRPEEMHCTTVVGYCTIDNQTALLISRKDALYQVVLYLFQIKK